MPHSPEDQIKILKHLAEKVMGWDVEMCEVRKEGVYVRNVDGLYISGADPWNPRESAEDALELLERCADCVRMRHLGGTQWVGQEKILGGGFIDTTEWLSFGDAATLACYRATGGADV